MGISSGAVQTKKSSYGMSAPRLVTNAIVYFNSRILSQLLTSFEYQGDTKRIDIVKQASPVAWHNINLKGTYHFGIERKIARSGGAYALNRGIFTRQRKVIPSGGHGRRGLQSTLSFWTENP